LHSVTRGAHQLDADFHLDRRLADQVLDLLGGTGRTLGKLKHFQATTAKFLPASPARAASTPAFKASRLVWMATSSITPMMDENLARRL
jgi:hypothetical protein